MKLLSSKYFLTTANLGSIRQAAEHLNVSASSITRQIQQLEHEFGCELFERRTDGMALTPEGIILQRHMQNTAHELDLARDEIGHLRNLVAGTIKFSSIEGTMSSWLLPTMTLFREKHEGIKFEGTIDSSEGVYHAVASDLADFGIALLDGPRYDIDIVKKFETKFKIVIAPDHKLARRKKVGLQDLKNHALVMLNTSFYTRQLFDQYAAKNHHTYDIALELNHIELLKREVIARGSITILPDYAIEEEISDGILRGFNVQGELPTRSSTILFKKKGRRMTQSSNAFIELLSEKDM